MSLNLPVLKSWQSCISCIIKAPLIRDEFHPELFRRRGYYKAIFPALSIDKASSWPFNEAGDMRSRLL